MKSDAREGLQPLSLDAREEIENVDRGQNG